jgi:hypothetical protein
MTIAAALLPQAVRAQQAVSPPAPVQVEALLTEPQFVVRAIDFATRTMGDGGGDKNGLYAEMGNMITGSGWISMGPGYRHWFGGDRVFADVSAAMSWRSYKMAHGRVELTNLARSRVAVGSEVKWQDFTQNAYFGQGADSLEIDRSEYRMKSLDVVGYVNVRPMKWLTIGGRSGWLRRPALLDPSGKFRRDLPATADVFPNETAFNRREQPNYLHGELSITADTRDHRSHPRSGAVYRGSWTRFSDRDGGRFSFQRFEAEGAQFATVPAARLTLAARGWLTASDTADGATIPFYLLPSLGGNNTLRSFGNYRFHDRHFVVANIEMRLALLDRLDAVLFADAGNVAPRMADLSFDKRSYGVGFRMHSTSATFARLDLAHGSEGWRLMLSTSDPLHLSRLSRRTAPIPFVP